LLARAAAAANTATATAGRRHTEIAARTRTSASGTARSGRSADTVAALTCDRATGAAGSPSVPGDPAATATTNVHQHVVGGVPHQGVPTTATTAPTNAIITGCAPARPSSPAHAAEPALRHITLQIKSAA
jgi:hypothetical protein